MTSTDTSVFAFLESLDVPAASISESIQMHTVDSLLRMPHMIVSEDFTRQLWAEWHPENKEKAENDEIMHAFRELLKSGIRMGYRLGRFKDVTAIKDNVQDPGQWLPRFEEAVNIGELRLFVNESRTSLVEGNNWEDSVNLMRDGLFYELGIHFPSIQISPDPSLNPNQFRIEWNDLKLPPDMGIGAGKLLVNDTLDRISLLNITGEKAINPANGSESALISIEHKALAEESGLTTWDETGYLILLISAKIRRNAHAFVNESFIDLLLYQLNQVFPATVELIEEKVNKYLLIQLIRGLLAEEISIRNLQLILDTLLTVQSGYSGTDLSKYIVFTVSGTPIFGEELADATAGDYVNIIRARLKKYISHKYTRGRNTLVVYLMDPVAEGRLRQQQKLSEIERAELLRATRDEVGGLPPTSTNPVILTTMEVRQRLYEEVHGEFPYLAVLCYQELSPDMNIQPIARISPDLPALVQD